MATVKRYTLGPHSAIIGRIDPIIRQPFEEGDTVVECGNGHVYSLRAWEGPLGYTCPTCGSSERDAEPTQRAPAIQPLEGPTVPSGMTRDKRRDAARPTGQIGRWLALGMLALVILGLAILIGVLGVGLFSSMGEGSADADWPTLAPPTENMHQATLPAEAATAAIAEVPDQPTATPPPPTQPPTPTTAPVSAPLAATADAILASGNPLAEWAIPVLASTEHDGGEIVLEERLFTIEEYTQWAFSYFADGYYVTGLVNIPNGDGPFPVALVLHGGIDQTYYQQGDGSAAHANILAYNGYVAFMPDYRSYNNTEGSGTPLKLPWVVDVLSLIDVLPTLPQADPARVGVLGHSRGGGIAGHVMVTADVDAVVLYAPLSLNDASVWYRYRDVFAVDWPEEDAAIYGSPESNPQGYAFISPIFYLDRATMPVQIHHGTQDGVLPVEWSRDLYSRMEELNLPVEYYEYPAGEHTFTGDVYAEFIGRVVAFFDEHVK